MSATLLRIHRAVPAGLGLAVLVIGVLLGFAAPSAARWLDDALERSPLPSPGVFGVIGNLPLTWSIPIFAALGLVAGAALAFVTIRESLALTIADDHAEYQQEGHTGWIERSEVASAHLDGKELVLLRPGGSLRARFVADALDPKKLASAMRAHGWRWEDSDPYADKYEPWVDGRPGFAPHEHALLRKRQETSSKAQARQSADQELSEHGLVVRLQGKQVLVRRIDASGD